MGRKDALYFARQAERRAKHDPAAGGGRAAQSAAHNPIAELEAKVARLEKEKAEQYQRAQFYRGVLQEIRDNTPAGQPNDWPHHHWYLSKASKAINHVALEGKQE